MLILFLIFSFHPDICQPGWGYFEGYCYFTSLASLPWLAAESNSSAMGSQLVTIHNQEENVYVQHRHNGERSWIGLNYRSVEGSFVWTKEARLMLLSLSAVGVTRVILLLKRDLTVWISWYQSDLKNCITKRASKNLTTIGLNWISYFKVEAPPGKNLSKGPRLMKRL